MSRNKYKYSTNGDLDDCYQVETVWDENDAAEIAEDCAENFHNAHDGCESSWPVDIAVWTMDDKEVGRFSVEREHEPRFSARKLKDSQP